MLDQTDFYKRIDKIRIRLGLDKIWYFVMRFSFDINNNDGNSHYGYAKFKNIGSDNILLTNLYELT